MEFTWEEGQTPIDQDEASGLIPAYITTMGQLNDAEAKNIADAANWLRKARIADFLTSRSLKLLHQKMFGDVWRWAGIYRDSDKNIGIDHLQIAVQVEELVRNVKTQIQHKAYSDDELAMRFHHRLTYIHPFPNGNGRHARLAADTLLVRVLKKQPFSWGASSKKDPKELRKEYVAALGKADRGDYSDLLPFGRS